MNSLVYILILITVGYSFSNGGYTTRSGSGSCGTLPNAVDSTCTCDITQCTSGYLDCDLDPSTGCEINSQTDPLNCDACGTICSSSDLYEVDTYNCNTGVCGIASCVQYFEDCDLLYSTGCEVNSQIDSDNCGDCGVSCAPGVNVQSASCISGTCTITACNTHFEDCNNIFSDGCESDSRTDLSNCGGCGSACLTPINVIPKCIAGACNYSKCQWESVNCDGIIGCEKPVHTFFIYSDVFNSAKFTDQSLAGSVYSFTGTTVFGSSLYSLSYTPTPSDSLRFTCSNCIQIPKFSSGITFEINGGTTGGQSINIVLIKFHYGNVGVTVERVATLSISDYLTGGNIVANDWRKATITYSNASFTKYDGIFIENALTVAQATVYFDNIQLLPASC